MGPLAAFGFEPCGGLPSIGLSVHGASVVGRVGTTRLDAALGTAVPSHFVWNRDRLESLSGNGPMSHEDQACVDRMIRARRTEKVLAKEAIAYTWPQEEIQAGDALVQSALAVAGWTPFHYPLEPQGRVEPWQVYLLRQLDATRLADRIEADEAIRSEAGKIPALLRGCGSLALVYEEPDTRIADLEKRATVNREHLMAVAAFAQSLLLALQARGLGTYWSSGGVLHSEVVKQWLEIPPGQNLVAAVFVDYHLESPPGTVERVPGKLRESRTTVENWTRVIELPAGPLPPSGDGA